MICRVAGRDRTLGAMSGRPGRLRPRSPAAGWSAYEDEMGVESCSEPQVQYRLAGHIRASRRTGCECRNGRNPKKKTGRRSRSFRLHPDQNQPRSTLEVSIRPRPQPDMRRARAPRRATRPPRAASAWCAPCAGGRGARPLSSVVRGRPWVARCSARAGMSSPLVRAAASRAVARSRRVRFDEVVLLSRT